jgi:sigma-E factor negative regulatory protein RseC
MDEIGVVSKTDGIHATVSVTRKSACEHCTTGTCKVSEDKTVIEALNTEGAEVGQTVKVTLEPYTYMAGTMVFYGIPALALVAGAIIGKEYMSPMFPSIDPDGVSAIFSFGALALSFIIVKLWSMKAAKETRYQAIITEILQNHIEK